MKSSLFRLTTVLFLLYAVQASAQSEPSIWNGIYSDDQAARGQEVYNSVCSSCHAADLRGNSNAPSLTGMSFMFLWEGRSVGELFTTVQTRMPSENPNSLPARNYRDVVAYILQANNFPSGDVELSSDVDTLNQTLIEPE